MPTTNERAALDCEVRNCLNYGPGHTAHWIQVRHSMDQDEQLAEQAVLVEARRNGTVVLDMDGKRQTFWNHEPVRLARLAARNDGRVTVQERWRLLRTASPDGAYCFSILIPEKDTKRRCQPYRQQGHRSPPSQDVAQSY